MSVDLSIDGHVAHVVLNRPEALNSIDAQMRAELNAAWRHIAEASEIRVMVMSGAGERAFCTGADLKAAGPVVPAAVQATDMSQGHLLAAFPWDVPSICAIRGYALGGGLEIALACDIRIADETARLGLTEVRVGSIPGAGGTQLLPRVVGRAAALQMAMTGERVEATRALGLGLVSEVVPAAELMARAEELARSVASNAPLAVRAVKRLVSEAEDVALRVGLRHERAQWGLIRDTEDRAEGRSAFAEKRAPIFKGR